MDKREKEYHAALQRHKETIESIKGYEERMNELSPFELSKMEYLYATAERMAWKVAGYFRTQAKHYEGMAEIAQGTTYKQTREDDQSKSATDAQYESRVAKGHCLDEASMHEGDYIAWKGFALSYEGSRNAIKDMLKGIEKEGG